MTSPSTLHLSANETTSLTGSEGRDYGLQIGTFNARQASRRFFSILAFVFLVLVGLVWLMMVLLEKWASLQGCTSSIQEFANFAIGQANIGRYSQRTIVTIIVVVVVIIIIVIAAVVVVAASSCEPTTM